MDKAIGVVSSFTSRARKETMEHKDKWAQTILVVEAEAVGNLVANMTVNVAAWQVTVHLEGKKLKLPLTEGWLSN